MITFKDTIQFSIAGPTAVTLGKFDGLHLGHQKLLRRIREISSGSTISVVFALNAKKEELILTDDEQKEILEGMGIDCLIKCPFVPAISTMSPRRFVEEILIGSLHASHVVVGTDFRFGYQRAGDASFLKSCEESYPLQVTVLEKEKYHGREISSTYVREAAAASDMPLVSALMGRPFPIHGTVLHGRHLGTKLGLPTANLVPEVSKLLPPNGVYFSRTCIDGEMYQSITNIGRKPTVGSSFRGVETYLLDTDKNLYGRQIRVDLLAYVRPEQKFETVDILKEQIRQDISSGREYFREHGGLEG